MDTSASMQQKSFVSGRSTLLDVAKGAVEFFVKMRQKSPESRGDRYMLLTFEEYPRNIKAGWKENLQTFMNELKNLEANGMTTMGSALKQVFDTLNINRMQTGIDMYGQGRYPFYLEPAVIVVISDGGKLTTQGSVQFELNLPMHSSVPGSELTREPFRWDQRLYALVLRMAGTPPMNQESGHVASDYSPIDAMCEVTGGRSYAVTSQRVLHQCIDSLVQKLQSGVVIHFEKIGPDPPPLPLMKEGDGQIIDDDGSPLSRADTADTLPLDEDSSLVSAKGLTFSKDSVGSKDSGSGIIGGGSNPSRPHTPNPILAPTNVAWHNCRKLIYVPRSAQKGFAVGFWPLPEAFWPDIAAPALPQRSAHPNIKFTCTNQEPMIIDNLPFDKYELEPSLLTLYILARKQPKTCWQVYIQGSSKSGGGGSAVNAAPDIAGHPFGYLKASTNLLTVNLFVLPYNYPVLLPLLDELFKVHRVKPTGEWRTAFQGYLRTMPAYYAGPLRRVLTRMGAGNLATSLIPETMDNCLSYSVLNYLKRLKNQAKMEYDKTLNTTPLSKSRIGPEGIKIVPRSPFKKELLTNNLLKDKFSMLREQLTDFPGFLLGIKDTTFIGGGKSTNNRFRNPFDIPRKGLLDQIVRMRANYLQPSVNHTKLIDDDSRHTLPIAQMGNYQDYLKKMPLPLREIESTPVRQHMFGNPFKINKNMIMDEVVLDEVSLVASGAAGQGGIAGQGAVVGANSSRNQKRQSDSSTNQLGMKRFKKGPLPRDFIYRKTPPGTPTHIPPFEHTETGSMDILIDQLQLSSEHQQLGVNLALSTQLTPPVSPMNYHGDWPDNKLAMNGTTVTNNVSNNTMVSHDNDENNETESGQGNMSLNLRLENYAQTRQNSASNLIAAANASGNQENSSLLTNVQQPLIQCTIGNNVNHSYDMSAQLRQDSFRFNSGISDQTLGPLETAGIINLTNTSGHDSNQLASRMVVSPSSGISTVVEPVTGTATSPLQALALPPMPNQSRNNGINQALPSSSNVNRHTSPQSRSNHITNGVINGNNISANFSGASIVMNGLSSLGKRKSRGSRDNSPVPPTFSRQNIKAEVPLANAALQKLTKEELRSINLRNQNMRQIIYKEVKRPGKNHDRLFKMLKEDLHGPPQIRKDYIKEVIAEAGRFKRKALVDLIEQKMEELVIVGAT